MNALYVCLWARLHFILSGLLILSASVFSAERTINVTGYPYTPVVTISPDFTVTVTEPDSPVQWFCSYDGNPSTIHDCAGMERLVALRYCDSAYGELPKSVRGFDFNIVWKTSRESLSDRAYDRDTRDNSHRLALSAEIFSPKHFMRGPPLETDIYVECAFDFSHTGLMVYRNNAIVDGKEVLLYGNISVVYSDGTRHITD